MKLFQEDHCEKALRSDCSLQTHTECIPLELTVIHHLVEVHKTLKTQLNHCCSVEIVRKVLLS